MSIHDEPFFIHCYIFSRSSSLFLLGKYSEQLPKKEEVNQEFLPLLFEAVSVNANYTSKIEVRRKDFYRNNCFFLNVARHQKKMMVVYQNRLVIKLNVLY
jgi:hypothetical protein